LGPLLFLIYINDLSDVFESNAVSKCFADDVKLYTEVTCGDDIDGLQFSIDSLMCWANLWQLEISFDKCCTFDIACGNKIGFFSEYTIAGFPLRSVDNTKDLVIIFDAGLNFTTHSNRFVDNAHKVKFFFVKTFI